MEKDVALAQHSWSLMLAEKKYASPDNWAPYVLIGDYR